MLKFVQRAKWILASFAWTRFLSLEW